MSAADSRYENAVARYFEAWNATDRDALAKAVAAAWSTDGSYTDPLAEVRGHDGIGPVDGHHDIARFGWELVNEADGTAPVAGFDVITLDGDDRIRSVHGFLDRVPTQ
jgi:hypothetical protein